MGMGKSKNLKSKGLFTRSVTISVPVKVTVIVFIIVPMATATFTDRMSLESTLSVKDTVSIDTMLNCDSVFHGHGHVDVTCEQTLIV